ncbi:S-layer homology domain-containing protein [Bhargavaea ginsengi]|uniref:S-layer homology domain-containing protein n=1 Tax=Bhargavaea ginsengi TaxID=426757 RepID=UPI00203C3E1C|nr:S-layer homology domain-containing protein [Bhargavaea ginsengi]MCM3087956.1 S-layer homology domain-containing protein [Bhargavaea ginsengi]
MKSKTYKRATALAAASVLVGSAIVPVAAAPAETPEKFSDVPTSSSHYETILEARALGIMTGYGDSTFKPDQKLNRGNVAKAFGKYVVAKSGLTLEEYVVEHNISKVENFTDVPDDWVDKELVTYSKIVKDAGIFKGSNNQLEASKLMPRDQIAEVLVRAFGFSDQEGDPGISDTDQSGYAKSIEIIYENGISNANPYRPLESTSRGQFASFLVRAYKVAEELDPQSPYPFPVESVHDIEDITITVGEKPDLPETVGVTLESGVTTIKAVKWNTNNLAADEIGTYKIIGDVADTDLTASVQVVVKKPTYTEPVTISASNNVIMFRSEELSDSALDLSNYKFNGGPMPVGTTIELFKDGGMMITLETPEEVPEDTEYTIEFSKNVKTKSGKIFANDAIEATNGTEEPVNFTMKGKFYDNVPPRLISAHYIVPSADSETTGTIQLTFSEEMAPLYQSLGDFDPDHDLYKYRERLNHYNSRHIQDDLILKVGGTEIDVSHIYVENGKFYIDISPLDIDQSSTVTIVPEGKDNEALVIKDDSLGSNPAVAPVTKTITKEDVVIIEPIGDLE